MDLTGCQLREGTRGIWKMVGLIIGTTLLGKLLCTTSESGLEPGALPGTAQLDWNVEGYCEGLR